MKVVTVKAAKLHLYEITFDDGQQGLIDKTVWEHSGFGENSTLSDAQWQALLQCSDTHRAREKALYYLSLRDYGSGELIAKLRRAGIDKELAQHTVQRLTETGLIDDARYAAVLARDMSTRKLYPRRRVAMALREKGFSSEVVEQAVSQLPDEEEQLALELLCKKRYNGTNGAAAREKALAQLARYGFSYAVSKRALALWEEQFAEDIESDIDN